MVPPFVKPLSSHVVAALLGATSTLVAIRFISGKHEGVREDEGKGNVSSYKNVEDGKSRHKDITPLTSRIDSTLPFIQSPITILHPNKNMEIASDARTRNPVYVMERLPLGRQEGKRANRREHKFYEEKSIPEHLRSHNGFFRKSGFDRGHLAASANYSTSEDMGNTYSLANVSPQHPIMNRRVWLRLEEKTRAFLIKKGQKAKGGSKEQRHAFVVSGPLWLPSDVNRDRNGIRRDLFQYSYLGIGTPPNLIHVPTHFFKIIYTVEESENNNGQIVEIDEFAAFVIPNKSFDKMESVNLQDFLVRITDLESVSGITFFRCDNLKKKLDHITEEVWMRNETAVNALDEQIALCDEDEGVGMRKEQPSIEMSKSRKARIRKQSREMQKGGKLPKHICSGGSCDEVIRVTHNEKK